MTLKVLVVDPPEGWLYGFPKPFPGGVITSYKDKVKWFLDNDYPQELIDQGMLQYCRYWQEDIDEIGTLEVDEDAIIRDKNE